MQTPGTFEKDSPLHKAAGGASDPATLDLLIVAGANLHARTDMGYTPLHNAAASNANPAIAAALIEEGLSPGDRDEWGRTSLHLAAGFNTAALAAKLIDRRRRGQRTG